MNTVAKNQSGRGDKLQLRHVHSIVAAFDGSSDSKRALKEARRLARQHRALLTVIQVVPPITCQADYGYGPVTRILEDVEAETETKRHLSRMLRAQNGLPRAAVVVRSGNAWQQISKAADELHADLIVMGSHPHELPESPVSSDMENHGMSACACATLIVKPGGVELRPASYVHDRYSTHL